MNNIYFFSLNKFKIKCGEDIFSLDKNRVVKIDGNNIKIVVSSENKDTDVANKIMRSVQSNYESKKYITVEFKQALITHKN